MGKITLSLPEELQSIVDRETAFGEFADEAAFIESLIRDHRERKLAALVAALEAGERSGISDRSIDQVLADAREKFLSGAR
jgi:antitoxin ParD1/3/4